MEVDKQQRLLWMVFTEWVRGKCPLSTKLNWLTVRCFWTFSVCLGTVKHCRNGNTSV